MSRLFAIGFVRDSAQVSCAGRPVQIGLARSLIMGGKLKPDGLASARLKLIRGPDWRTQMQPRPGELFGAVGWIGAASFAGALYAKLVAGCAKPRLAR